MSRIHIHIAVGSIDDNVNFYSALFGAQPEMVKSDYVKWSLENPAVNFSISSRGAKTGIDHIGIQAESETEQLDIESRLKQAAIAGFQQTGTHCCYSKSDKYWVTDPQGVPWETFHTLESIPFYGSARNDESVAESECCGQPANVSGNCC